MGVCKNKGCKGCTPDACPYAAEGTGYSYCPAYKSAYDSNWKKNNPDKVNISKKKYAKTHHEKATQSQKEYIVKIREEKPERYWAMGSIGSHKVNGYDVAITTDDAAQMLIDTKYICPLCHKPMRIHKGQSGGFVDSPTLDDIDASHGLVHGNVRVICRRCNTEKGDRSDEDWLAAIEVRISNLERLMGRST
jgi:hypothetical protein